VAGEMMEDFNLFYNIARQAGITSELAEISAGITAMEG
jgi:F0F1-type ATP synthase gamma subunit